MAIPQLRKTDKDKFYLWSTPTKYALALLCWSNTLGNAHKFPTLAQKYGNIQILLPYAVVTVFLIIPLVFTELAIGQYSNNGFGNMWRMAPVMRGLTWFMATITFFATHYSLFTTTHAGYYLLKSFETTLPWTKCDPIWATDICVEPNQYYVGANISAVQNSVEHFYREQVLSENAMSFSEVNLRLFIFLIATLVIIALCLVERIKSIEKLLMFLTLVPLILLMVITIAALINDTNFAGLSAFVEPDFQTLLDYRMWLEVVNNAMTNIGLCMGGLVCISAHGHFRSNIYAFAMITPLCNLIQDAIFTIFVYSNLALDATQKYTTVSALFRQDTSLIFVKIPASLLNWTSHQQLWTIVYFSYLYLIGVRYLLFLLFTLSSALHETFHCVYYLRRFSIAVLCFIILFVMPLYISPVGSPMFIEMENFCSSTFITFIATLQTIGIFYIYDARKLLVDVHFMLNKKINNMQYFFYGIPVVLAAVAITNFFEWAWMSRDYETSWIFIIECVIVALMIMFYVAHLVTYVVANWSKGYKWMFAPGDNWGCADEEMRKNREAFKSETIDARFTYRQELYERTL